MSTNTNTCAHPGCECPVSEDHLYCSAYCKTAGHASHCACGHPDCNGDSTHAPTSHRADAGTPTLGF
jgi:hypothetical protein